MIKPKYDHKEVEEGRYQEWLKGGFFDSGDLSKKPFTIVIPPPNVTGKLHLGHAWDTAIQDMIIRRKRMQGYDALWVPGMDHAGIATQAKVDQKLRAQGISRYDLGREEYLKVAWSWKKEYAEFIHAQWAKLGLSLDYNKERFTLDEGLNKAVNYVFVTLYNKGLIYRGERIINWDCEAKTALSNVEIEHEDTNGAFYYFKYMLKDSDDYLVIATTRPETMFGDTAIMVHPSDERFKDYVGKEVYIPTTNRLIPVITDYYVDKNFGTGCVKVTPAHDPNDFEVGRRHKLDMPLCMNEDGTMNELAHKYQGMDRFECRKELVKDIDALGLLVKIEPIVHSVGYSERTKVMVEPRLSKQWFVKMKPLVEQALSDDTLSWIPRRFEKTYRNWMENLDDWCISRQLWWGHRIPVYYKGDEIIVSETKPEGIGYIQDEDVLDTWFSSALWPFSTLGWPEKTIDFERYFPNDVLVTAYDIIFFWVARMIFQGKEFTGKMPFKEVLIHGLIRDKDGRKMSKSLGNGVDPMDEIEKYGADSLRYFLTTNSSPGQDLRYDPEKVEASWNFINKLWNISRFVLMMVEDLESSDLVLNEEELDIPSKWILTNLNNVIKSVDANFDKYEFGEVARALYNFTWNDFAPWYLEMAKLKPNDHNTKVVLVSVLKDVLKMLHPFIPFVTEELYLKLPVLEKSIMVASWPTASYKEYDVLKEMNLLMDIVTKTRNIRNEYNVPLSKKIDFIVKAGEENKNIINELRPYLDKFININEFNFTTIAEIKDTVNFVSDEVTVSIPLGSLVDSQAEKLRLENELVRLEKEIARSNGMLNNQNFISKANPAKVEEEREKLTKYQKSLEEVKNALSRLN